MAETIKGKCTECGKKTTITIIDEVTKLCEDCIDELDYVLCDHCEEYWLYDVIKFYYMKNEKTLCEHCAEALLEDGEITEEDIESISDCF